MIFGDTQKIPETVQIEIHAERMLLAQIQRSIREYLVDKKIVEPGAPPEEFEMAAARLNPDIIEKIKTNTTKLSRDLFLQMAKDQHNLDLLKGDAQKNKLTGLANKEMATTTFELLKTLPEFSKEHNPMAVVRLDLDGFKLINDQAGHPAGDEVLKLVGQRIKAILSRLRATDLAIHFSGDEFGLIVTNLKPGKTTGGKTKTLPETVEEVVARVISSIEQIASVRLDDGTIIPVTLSASAGFKIVQYGDISTFSTIDNQAEKASLLSKNCKGISGVKTGVRRIADADKTEEEFLRERSIPLEDYEESRITGGFNRPTNDLLAQEANKTDRVVTPEMRAAALELTREFVAKLKALV